MPTISLQPETKTPYIVRRLTRLGVDCPVSEFKVDLQWNGDALQDVVRDDTNSAIYILVSGRPGSSGDLTITLYLPSGGKLSKTYTVVVPMMGDDPDDLEFGPLT